MNTRLTGLATVSSVFLRLALGISFCPRLQTGLVSGAFTESPMWHGAMTLGLWPIRLS